MSYYPDDRWVVDVLGRDSCANSGVVVAVENANYCDEQTDHAEDLEGDCLVGVGLGSVVWIVLAVVVIRSASA